MFIETDPAFGDCEVGGEDGPCSASYSFCISIGEPIYGVQTQKLQTLTLKQIQMMGRVFMKDVLIKTHVIMTPLQL